MASNVMRRITLDTRTLRAPHRANLKSLVTALTSDRDFLLCENCYRQRAEQLFMAIVYELFLIFYYETN